MNPFSAFVIFLILWWLCLFMILPQNIRGQAEEGNIVKGTEPGAPVNPHLKIKFIRTTQIAFVLWLMVCALIMSGLVDWTMLGNVFARSA